MTRDLWIMRAAFGIAGALLATACITPPDYRAMTADCVDRNHDVPVGAAASAPFFVTAQLPDCRGPVFTLTRYRMDEMRQGRLAPIPPGRIVESAGDEDPRFQQSGSWWTDLDAARDAHGGAVLLYVHGYNNSFAEAAERARIVAATSGFQGPVVIFAWPSRARLAGYMWDETNIGWSHFYFETVLTNLARRSDRVILVSHSMGSRAAVEGLVALERSDSDAARKVDTVIFAAPDMDRARFDRDVARELVRDWREITVYVSHRDWPLRLSWNVHGSPRAGDPSCWYSAPRGRNDRQRCHLHSRPGFTVVDTSAVRDSTLGHSDFAASRPAIFDLCRVIARARPEDFRGRNPIGPDIHGHEMESGFFLTDAADDGHGCPGPGPDALGAYDR